MAYLAKDGVSDREWVADLENWVPRVSLLPVHGGERRRQDSTRLPKPSSRCLAKHLYRTTNVPQPQRGRGTRVYLAPGQWPGA